MVGVLPKELIYMKVDIPSFPTCTRASKIEFEREKYRLSELDERVKVHCTENG